MKLKNLLGSTMKEKESLSLEHREDLRKIEEAESRIKDLRIEADARRREISSLSEKIRLFEAEAPARTKELEDEIRRLKSELESLQQNKRHLKGQLESRTANTKELREENKRLQAIISELELTVKNKQKEVSNLLKILKDTENNGSCKVAEWNAQVHELQLEVDLVRAQKRELEEKIESLRNEQVVREQEFNKKMESLRNEQAARDKELEEQMESFRNDRRVRQREFDDMQKHLQALVSQIEGKNIEIEGLKEELARRNKEEQRVLEESSFLEQQVEGLKLKVNSLCSQEHELKEKLVIKSAETDYLREEKERVEAKVSELDRNLTERGDEVASLCDRLRAEADANSTQITGLNIEIESLRQELDSLETQKSRLELNSRIEEEETSRRMSLLENENARLTSMVQDLQSKINEHGRSAGRPVSSNSSKQVKSSPRSSKLEACSIERKMEELAEDCRMNLEDNIRILCQRIRVVEQLHMENKESYKTTKDRFQDDYKSLEEKVSFYKNEMKKIMEASMAANNTISELDLSVRKSDENSRNILNRVSKASKEIQLMKDWFLQMKRQTDRTVAQEDAKVQGLEDSEEVKKLKKEVAELEGTVRARDNVLLVLGEEKREAIRQLCILIDYQRGRCDYLKEVISKMIVKRKK